MMDHLRICDGLVERGRLWDLLRRGDHALLNGLSLRLCLSLCLRLGLGLHGQLSLHLRLLEVLLLLLGCHLGRVLLLRTSALITPLSIGTSMRLT